MKILVTGGAGFIGFHTARTLLGRGDEVVILDNLNEYYDSNLKKARVRELKKDYRFIFTRADISDYKAVKSVFDQHKFNKVCHLAAQAGVRYSLEKPLVYGYSNIIGTLNLLELCRRHNVKDFIFASSSSVYGDNKKIPFSEEDRVDKPISLYAATKKSNEEMAYAYHHLFRINCTGLRFFTAYGPWGRPDMALFKFTDNIAKGKKIEVFNKGNMIRDFTYIDDIVSGVVSAIDRAYAFEIFNLGRGQPIKLLEFIGEIEKNLGIRARKKMMPMQPGDVHATFADISKAKKMIGYSPKTSVKEGIKRFVEWYKDYYGQGRGK